MQKELVKSLWFTHVNPSRPGVYLTRSTYSGNHSLSWWRAFDGENWRAGIAAMSCQGMVVNTAPKLKDALVGAVIGDHISIKWCGVAK